MWHVELMSSTHLSRMHVNTKSNTTTIFCIEKNQNIYVMRKGGISDCRCWLCLSGTSFSLTNQTLLCSNIVVTTVTPVATTMWVSRPIDSDVSVAKIWPWCLFQWHCCCKTLPSQEKNKKDRSVEKNRKINRGWQKNLWDDSYQLMTEVNQSGSGDHHRGKEAWEESGSSFSLLSAR